ncbi:MAG: DNA polymerase I [Phycisphaeraceae bacterium]|nr:DNA polymerase I [Phycisphaeraceae bacterium]
MPRTFYIIDGHAQIFRAYFAIRGGMSSSVTGEPTHAVFAFAGMMFQFFEQLKPERAVMAIDLPGKTFRDELDPQYKAQRPPPPEDFHSQEQRIFEMVRRFGIPIVSCPGDEADDVIATLTRRVLADPALADVNVQIISKDKDLQQLLSDRVVMFDIHHNATVDVAALKQEKGITPQQVVDLLALTGDTADNIPGVPGIGDKTAALLLQQFGSIDGIYAQLDQIKGKRRENLEASRGRMPLNRQLVKLKDDLELDFTLDDARLKPVDVAGLRALFTDMGFRRHVQALDQFAPAPPAPPAPSATQAPMFTRDEDADGLFAMLTPMAETPAEKTVETPAFVPTEATSHYRAITTLAQLDALAHDLSRATLISVDTETIGLGYGTDICGISIAYPVDAAICAVYIPVRSPDPSAHLDVATVVAKLKFVLENPTIGKCGHNLKYDLHSLRRAGIELRGTRFDSMIAAFLLNMPARGMDDLALSLLNRRNSPISSLIGEEVRGRPQRTMDQVPLDQITAYAAEDADVTLQLHDKLAPMLEQDGMADLAHRVEMPLVEVLATMEGWGIRVDPDELFRQKEGFLGRIAQLRDEVQTAAGMPFNPDSPKQLADVLFNQLKLPVVKRGKTGPSTDVEVLEKLADSDDLTVEQAKVPSLIVEYRQLTKLVNTYLDNLRESIDPKDGRVHATFHQTGAATGRLSSSGPNLQNIPIRTELGRRIRKAFLAETGWKLISADYSQIELRVLAHLSEDEGLLSAFARDEDIHAAVASQVFGVPLGEVTREQRSSAKVINFGIVYGITAFGLARRIEGLDKSAARALIDSYRARFAGIDRFLFQCVSQAESQGYVTTIMGRRRPIPQLESRNGQTRALGERLAINSVVQGSAADLIKLAMVNLQRRIEREKLPLRMLLQIHDELVLEAPDADAEAMARIVKDEMERAMTLKAALKVDAGIGADWFDCK